MLDNVVDKMQGGGGKDPNLTQIFTTWHKHDGICLISIRTALKQEIKNEEGEGRSYEGREKACLNV